jgi:hypothetical protein
MAVIQNGSMVAWIRGKVGTNVFKTWKNKQVVQAYNAAPFKVPASDKMTLMQNLMIAANAHYDALTDTEKKCWENYAKLLRNNKGRNYRSGGELNIVPPAVKYGTGRQIYIGNEIRAHLHGSLDPSSWDLLNQSWNDLTGWTKFGTGTASISPAGQLYILPNDNNYIIEQRDIGSLPSDGFTLQSRFVLDNVGDLASGAFYSWQLFDGAVLANFRIFSDYIAVQKTDLSFVTAALVSSTGTWYTFRLIVDMDGETLSVYRKTDVTDWEFVSTFTELRDLVDTDGIVRVYMERPAGTSAESHTDYTRIASGLYVPTVAIECPLMDTPPRPIVNLEASWAAGSLNLEWTLPDGWDSSCWHVAFWISGTISTEGKVFRQWAGMTVEGGDLQKTFEEIYVAGGDLELLTAIVPVTLRIQAQTVCVRTGAASPGSNTVEIALT